MRKRGMVGLVGVIALVASACSSSSHPGAVATLTSTSSSTAVSSSTASLSTTVATTTTTRPTSRPSGCLAPVNRSPNSGGASAWIQMVSSTVGYAVIGHTVVGTVDGVHWKPLYLAADDLSFVDATDASHVWVVGSRSLFTSVDGGRNWSTSSSSAVPLTTVHFISASVGWAVGGGTLLQTSTGGRVWDAGPSPCPVDRVCFADAEHGWLATHDSVYTTSSGGAQWKLVFTVRNPIVAPTGSPSNLQCTPGNDAWVLFDGNNCAMGTCAYIGYRCTATTTCTPVAEEIPTSSSDPLQGPGSGSGPFSIIDDHTAVFMGFTGPLAQPMSMMLLSDDGRTRGPKMVVPDGPTEAEPYAVSFTSRDRGWLVDTLAGAAHILATTDGGRTWRVQYAMPIP